MKNCNWVLAAAASATLACAGLARAVESDPTPGLISLDIPIKAADAPRSPLMKGLEQAGAASYLDNVGLNIGGWVEMSWTHNFAHPPNGINVARYFDFEDDDPTFNQFVLFIDKPVNMSGEKFDWGGRMEWMWGGDARLLHSGGLFDHYGFPIYPGSPGTGDGPDEQFDLTQLYIDLNLPFGSGILLRTGKFVTPMGYETINPITTPFYTRSLLFSFAIPLTNTGMLASYNFDKNWSGSLAVVRGWDQTLEDNNGQHSYLGQVKYTSDRWDFTGTALFGPEQFENNQDWRHVVDVIFVYREGDNLQFVLNGDYGWEGDGAADGGDGEWWGVAGYAIYTINDYVRAAVRAEYFSDHDGCRGLGTELHELTAGLAIHPFPKHEWLAGLMIRPEARWDHATDEIFDGGTDDQQFTIGGDVTFAF